MLKLNRLFLQAVFFMCEIEFLKAKNNSPTCRINGILLHSAYNPEAEAKKFVDSMQPISFNPKYILIIEPALSYAIPFLKEKFPETKICAVRFSKDFQKYDNLFSKTFYYSENTEKLFEKELNDFLGEDGILYTSFLQWTPTTKIFESESTKVWNIIKNCINLSQSVLNTKAYFSKRWIKNSFNLIKNISKTAAIQKGSSDIVICASGTSLKNSISDLKRIRNDIFLIAVSSALSVLIKNNIKPDLVISTDGGFWAKKHLKALLKNTDIPLAVSAESNVPKKVFKNTAIIPLHYPDGTGSFLLEKLQIPYINAERNGTVSGTAEKLALSITTGNVYFLGLDLNAGIGLQHTDPNELEMENSTTDSRISSKESRISKSRFNSNSLKVYENWFSMQNEEISKRVFRLSRNFKYQNKLGTIKDIDFSEVKINSKALLPQIKQIQMSSKAVNFELKNLLENENFLSECFPVEYLMYSREADETQKQAKYEEICKKASSFINSISGESI